MVTKAKDGPRYPCPAEVVCVKLREARIWPWKLGFGDPGMNLDLDAGIWDMTLELGPKRWDLGLDNGILAVRM